MNRVWATEIGRLPTCKVFETMAARSFTSATRPAVAVFARASGRAAAMRDELARRTALARQDAPLGVTAPGLPLLAGEMAALLPKGRRSPIDHAARKPRPVMVLPGFAAHPIAMRAMIAALNKAGHRARDWGQGFNLSPDEAEMTALTARLEAQAEREGEPVALIGWSLGGVVARELAKRSPQSVSLVITMGSPISGDRRANNAWRLYQFVTGHPVDAPPIVAEISAKPPVPTYAMWSPRDGIVAPRAAAGRPGERDRAIALRCRHLGFARDPEAIAAVLQLLDE